MTSELVNENETLLAPLCMNLHLIFCDIFPAQPQAQRSRLLQALLPAAQPSPHPPHPVPHPHLVSNVIHLIHHLIHLNHRLINFIQYLITFGTFW